MRNCHRLESEVGIYKRKQESKKTRKQELDQESDKKKQENKNSTKIMRVQKIFYFLQLGEYFPNILYY